MLYKVNSQSIFTVLAALLIILLACQPGSSLAQDQSTVSFVGVSEQDGVSQAMADLLKVLDEETELATKTKLNIDFVPGMVSVLRGKDMLARGATTVFDALGFLPGVELSLAFDGQIQIIVRGVGNTFSSGKVKVLLNGVAFNATLQAAMPALLWPLDQVDRIEVIRGPGSVIYGEFASVGVINIITYKKNDQVYLRGSDAKNNDSGIQVWKEFVDKDVSFSVSVSSQDSAGGQIEGGNDVLYGTPNQSVSNAPGPANTKRKNRYLILDLGYKDYALNWQYMQFGTGDYFGLANALPENNDRIVRYANAQGVELSKPWQFNSDTHTKLIAGWFRHTLKSEQHEIFPKNFTVPLQATFTDGVLGAPNYEEDKYYINYELSYKGIELHDFLFGVDYSKTTQGDTWSYRNYAVVEFNGNKIIQPRPNQIYTGEDNWLAEGLSRRVTGLYVQDQYAILKHLVLTGGLRYDDYDDIGGDITPRLAAVYQLSDEQTIKFQYEQSFRPPTFLEMFAKNNIVASGNPNLESEQLDSYDLGYVFNDGVTTGRVTLFYYELTGMISIDNQTKSYANQEHVHAKGMELEYIWQFNHTTKFDANVSYIKATIDNKYDMPGAAKFMGNLGVLYQPWPDYTLNFHYRHVGDRDREQNDTRSPLEGYDLFDFTLNVSNIFSNAITLRGTIKNIFDNNVLYPSQVVQVGPNSYQPAYYQDYPQLGREFIIQIVYEF